MTHVLVWLLVLLVTTAAVELDQLNHYEIVQFRQLSDDPSRHERVVEFYALNSTYQVFLRPTNAPVDPHFRVLDSDGQEQENNLDDVYEGYIVGNPSHKARLVALPSGAYIGVILIENDRINLEPAFLFDVHTFESDVLFYLSSDLNMSSIEKGISSSGAYPSSHLGWSPNYLAYNPFRPFLRNQRLKREDVAEEKKNRCSLKIVADYYFHREVGKGKISTTTRYIISIIASVNEIFKAVNWDAGYEQELKDRSRFSNFGFSVKELVVLTRYNSTKGHYNSREQLGSDQLLESFTQYEASEDFCLVHLMTARTFDQSGVLGVAYVAIPSQNAAGICSKSQPERNIYHPFNSAFTSAMGSTGKLLVTREAEIVVAHEYGHSWGAEHDNQSLINRYGMRDDTDCLPDYKSGGMYIMNEYAQPGFDPNNYRFSPCSIHRIRKILNQRWAHCFEEEKISYCGNGVVEEGEECDEGSLLLASSSFVSCCSPSCKLLPKAQCSHQNHPCCSTSCDFYSSTHICLNSTSWLCKGVSYCTGKSGDCPMAPDLSDGTTCDDDGQCFDGKCLPYCESIGKKSCLCENPQTACNRCCRANDTDACEPEAHDLMLREGSFCYQGTCKNSKCVSEPSDYLKFYLNVFQDSSSFWNAVSSNVVGIVIILSLPFWFIAGIWIDRDDARQRKLQERTEHPKLTQLTIPANQVPMPPYEEMPPTSHEDPSQVTDFF